MAMGTLSTLGKSLIVSRTSSSNFSYLQMNSQIKQKWLDALRSGQYEQTRGNLCNKHGFCCLGVLCDLYAKETQTEWGNESLDFRGLKAFLGEYATLPDEVMKWSGLKETNPTFKFDEDSCHVSLACLNDDGDDFEKIAKVIEEHL